MRTLFIGMTIAAAAPAFAQHAGHHHAHPPQPGGYAGMQTREIKALSPEQVADLREGRGMGASLPAELNLKTRQLLSAEQVLAYNRARGYAAGGRDPA